MSAIQSMIRAITREVDRQALILTFTDDRQEFYSSFNVKPLEAELEAQVIRGQLMPDLDISRGTRTTLPLDKGIVTYEDEESIAYHFKKEILRGRDIVTVYNSQNGSFGPPMASKGGRRKSIHETLVYPNNCLLISRLSLMDDLKQVEVMVSNDHNLNNIQRPYWEVLNKAAVILTKAMMFTLMDITLNGSALMGGEELGKLATTIESYSDQWEIYHDYRDTVTSSLVLNDTEAHNNYIALQLLPTLGGFNGQ